MPLSKHLTGVVVATFLASFAAQAQNQISEFRALWADAWHEGFRSPTEVSNLVSSVRAANCNALFVQVRKRGDAYYAGSPYEPASGAVKPGFDPLAEVVRLAHDTNSGPRVEVHAWFVTYPAASGMGLTNRNSIVPGKSAGKHPLDLHPDWFDQAESGAQSDGGQCFFDPGHPEVQKHLFQVAMDIISRYDIDGLHFDHARYPGANWGYNPASVARFNRRFHRTGKAASEDPDWLQFRRDQITALIRKVYLSAIALKPALKISASTVTWAPGIRSSDQWSASMPYRSALQDWRAWMEEGILDLNVPMDFFSQASPLYAGVFGDWASFAKDHKYGRHVAIGQGSYLNSIPNTLAQIQVARQATAAGNKAEGVALYSYAVPADGASGRAEFVAALASCTNGPCPFGTFVPTPEMPWKTRPTRGHLMGYACGASSSNILDGATVTLSGPTEKKLVTDATGFFGAVDLPPGSYTLVAAFPGWQPATATCRIEVGKVSSRNLRLKK